ncbi:MAG: histone H1 [Bacteroidetes bacterium GWE2_39_28]|nr:MAG: histone H1 [Bacteroidetes bacterium GWE2_39_28]OFY14373.1 MAG: histone H1 [Bacteroidetes bacterium GWF2_39_10]OFZ10290.1 MAG: histone H1 [Bacteroidetes bacterium RIFOXYC2_FULL_39_11]HCT95266.1 histone H1 [Rikenellaceae bacterium]
MKNLLESLNQQFESFFKDANQQAELGNKAAGARARKTSLTIEKAMKEFRKTSLSVSNK